jgi:hypothetical protein
VPESLDWVEAWETAPCLPGYYCGASMTLTTLTVAWTGKGRPTVGSVVDLYGTTVLRSLTPAGYRTAAIGCYIDYC